jgi:hypothetical protein
MSRTIKTIVALILGIIMIPALFVGGVALLGTVCGFILNPKIMAGILIVLGIISLPGVLIGWKIKKVAKGE